MKIACLSYRSWALKIYDQLKDKYEKKHQFLIFDNKESYNREKLLEFNPDLILWYGWSWIVEDIFVDDFTSVMLHPSPLPKYRGGSPIQNQIIKGEIKSAVSLFKMTKNLDDGDIYFQIPFSLSGNLSDIFLRITNLGFSATCLIIEGDYTLTPQDHNEKSFCKRRKPSDSEITLDELSNKPAEYIYNKIRMLADPYPNAYIVSSDNKKIYLTEAKIDKFLNFES